jgi:hypothetical protein
MVTGVKERPSPKARSTARSTASVAAVISDPMPSPSMTTSRTGVDDEAVTDHPPLLIDET